MNLWKGQTIWSYGIQFMFFMQLFVAKLCVCVRVLVCVSAKEYVCSQRAFFFRTVCMFKGRCLYLFTTAPELMRFRAENKALHFNSLASGAQQPAVQEGAAVAELYVCAR